MNGCNKTFEKTLAEKYPPSKPCSCEICLSYCKRPGWWTVDEADSAIEFGLAGRMMLEMSPELTFGVLSPAFKGCEGNFASDSYSDLGCNFLNNNTCEIHGSGHLPLECSYFHHDRKGLGKNCHDDIEKDWNSEKGKALVGRWCALTNFWARMGVIK